MFDYLISANGYIVVQITMEEGEAQLSIGARVKRSVEAERAFDGHYIKTDVRDGSHVVLCKC